MPELEPSQFDPINISGTVNITEEDEQELDRLEVNTLMRKEGDLRVNGPIVLSNGILYVSGDLDLEGSITGNGAVIVDGKVTIRKGSALVASNQVALLAKDDVSLLGQSDYSQGLVYTGGNLKANQITIVGGFVANSPDAEKGNATLKGASLITVPEAFTQEIPVTVTTTTQESSPFDGLTWRDSSGNILLQTNEAQTTINNTFFKASETSITTNDETKEIKINNKHCTLFTSPLKTNITTESGTGVTSGVTIKRENKNISFESPDMSIFTTPIETRLTSPNGVKIERKGSNISLETNDIVIKTGDFYVKSPGGIVITKDKNGFKVTGPTSKVTETKNAVVIKSEKPISEDITAHFDGTLHVTRWGDKFIKIVITEDGNITAKLLGEIIEIQKNGVVSFESSKKDIEINPSAKKELIIIKAKDLKEHNNMSEYEKIWLRANGWAEVKNSKLRIEAAPSTLGTTRAQKRSRELGEFVASADSKEEKESAKILENGSIYLDSENKAFFYQPQSDSYTMGMITKEELICYNKNHQRVTIEQNNKKILARGYLLRRFKYSISDIINKDQKTSDYRISSGEDTRRNIFDTRVTGDVSDSTIERDANYAVEQINTGDDKIQFGDSMVSIESNKIQTSQPKDVTTTNVVPFDFSLQKFISRGSKLRTIYWRNR